MTVTVRPAFLKSFDILALYKFVYYYYRLLIKNQMFL